MVITSDFQPTFSVKQTLLGEETFRSINSN